MLEPKEHYGKLHRQYHLLRLRLPPRTQRDIEIHSSPSGSVKNPLPIVTIEDAKKTGKLKPGQTVPFAVIHKIGNCSIKYSGKLASKRRRVPGRISPGNVWSTAGLQGGVWSRDKSAQMYSAFEWRLVLPAMMNSARVFPSKSVGRLKTIFRIRFSNTARQTGEIVV
jgi:hypothetical protein